MDRLEALGQSLSQITMYDIKSAYNQAKNMVLNVTEMEAKVQEATNEDPWGASSTLMQEIAQGTFSFQHFNEIMPAIYSRFMDKEARQWRQIYKALQLLEYLIKHGSERVVDDARSHISTIKMLRNFHYIDDKGKDEGINVRNRSREIAELLSDVEKIRGERRKAKANKHKYTGGGSRYGGFGSDELSGNDYGAYGGGSSSFRDQSRRGFEEYNAGDDEDINSRSSRTNTANNGRVSTARKASTPAPAPAPAPAPVEDLLGGFGDDDAFGSTTNTITAPAPLTGNNKALPAVSSPVGTDDDDFADFQAAPTQTTTAAPAPAAAKPNLMDLLGSTAPTTNIYTAPRPTQQPSFIGNTAANLGSMHRPSPSLSSPPQFSAAPLQAQPLFGSAPLSPTSAAAPAPTAAKSSSGAGAFDDLWSLSLGASSKSVVSSGQNKSIKDLEREKAMAGLWGGQKPVGTPMAATKPAVAPAPAPASSGDDWML
ncbi:hypothetical protein C0989_012010 [Termitomyces sp. Mn162]|nr:hypothetical protein C0989_012010 [Termitomyces sp. Mn162]